MMRRSLLVFSASLFLAVADAPLAADGAIPIWQPTTISHSGKYVVTRNITSNSGEPTLTIAANNVQVDLNGFTLRHSGQMAVVVAATVNGIVVENGIIAADGSHEGVRFANVHQFAVRRLLVTKNGYNETGIALTGCEIGTVENNIIDGPFEASLMISGGHGIHVQHNVFRNTDCEAGAGFDADNSTFTDNTLQGCSSLGISGSGNLIARNNLRATTVGGARNRIEHNTFVNSQGYGLRITGSENFYADNFARGNLGNNCSSASASTDFCDEGINNTSAGNNFMPNQF